MYGGTYYSTQRLDNVLKPKRAPLGNEYRAPLRLRVENQLGYKTVKWIERIEFIESEKQIGKGEGGTDEDDLYFDLLQHLKRNAHDASDHIETMLVSRAIAWREKCSVAVFNS